MYKLFLNKPESLVGNLPKIRINERSNYSTGVLDFILQYILHLSGKKNL